MLKFQILLQLLPLHNVNIMIGRSPETPDSGEAASSIYHKCMILPYVCMYLQTKDMYENPCICMYNH